MDVNRWLAVYYLHRNLPPEFFPPLANGKVIAVKQDGIRLLHLIRAEDADIVDEGHLLVVAKPDVVDNVWNVVPYRPVDVDVIFIVTRMVIIHMHFYADFFKEPAIIVQVDPEE